MIRVSDDQHTRTLILQPNRSMSWDDNRQVLVALAAATLLVPTLWALRGMWLALPLAVAEILALAFGLYMVCWKLTFRQVIEISAQHLRIAQGHYSPKHHWQLDRDDTALAVEPARHPWDRVRITLYDHHHRIAVGNFLNQEESESLLLALEQSGLHIRHASTEH
jgi:uncharacterized membrane protein